MTYNEDLSLTIQGDDIIIQLNEAAIILRGAYADYLKTNHDPDDFFKIESFCQIWSLVRSKEVEVYKLPMN